MFNPRLLVTTRALNFFGQELLPARLSFFFFFFVAPPTFLSPPLMDTKASGRKREESSYRSRVREWKRERGKKSEMIETREKERSCKRDRRERAAERLEPENSSLTAFVCSPEERQKFAYFRRLVALSVELPLSTFLPPSLSSPLAKRHSRSFANGSSANRSRGKTLTASSLVELASTSG